LRAPGAGSINLTRKVYTMSTKTHVVTPVMFAAAVAAVMSIALAPPASAIRGNCGGRGGGLNSAAAMKRGGCDDLRADLQRFFHDRDDKQQLAAAKTATK
jgi:hypothetical protein